MCVAMPGEIIELKNDTAIVNFGKIQKEVMVTLIPDLKKGDYVLVHAGFAINKIEKEEALKTLEIFKELISSLEGDSYVN